MLLWVWRIIALTVTGVTVWVWWGDAAAIWLVPWAVAGVLLADGDIRTRLIPRGRIYAGALVTIGCLIGVIVAGAAGWRTLLDAVLGGIGAFAALLVMRVLSSGGIGGGDVRLAGLLGLGAGTVIGPFGGLVVVAVGWLLHAAVALSGLARSILTMESTLPLGPSLVVASLASVIATAVL